jgi:hypothetical protein
MSKNDWVVGDPKLAKQYEEIEKGMKKDDLVRTFIDAGRLEIIWSDDKNSVEHLQVVKEFKAENESKGEK